MGKKQNRNAWEQKIIKIITKYPGIYFRQIQKTLNIPVGTLTHHLQSFEKQEKIISTKHKHFDYKYYWIKEQYNYQHPLIQSGLSHTELKIYNIIKNIPGIIQKQITVKIKKSQSVTSYHLSKMRKNKTVRCRKVGKTKTYYIL